MKKKMWSVLPVQHIIRHQYDLFKDYQRFKHDLKQQDHKTEKIMTNHRNSRILKIMDFQNPGF
jgi:hypothetical protein